MTNVISKDNNFSLAGKTVLNISNRQNVVDLLKTENPDKIIWCKKIAECKKNINKADVLIIDDYFESREQYLYLKKIIQIIFKSDLKSNFKLIINKNDLESIDDLRIYRELINDFLETLIKLKNFNKQSSVKTKTNYLKMFSKQELPIQTH